jgi:hypothetical protein
MTTFRLPLLIGILAFLVSFVVVAQPGQAQAALTLNNFWGCETNGADEFRTAAGTPNCVNTNVRSGDWSLELNGAASCGEMGSWEIIEGSSTDSGNDYILGFAFRITNKTDDTFEWLRVFSSSSGLVWQLSQEADGDLRLEDSAQTFVATATDPFVNNTWHFVEVRWQHLDAGAIDIWVDGSPVLSETGVDMSLGTSVQSVQACSLSAGTDLMFDDLYMYSGASGTGDFLGNAEVFRYQANTNSATQNGTCSGSPRALDTGVWQDLGETPRSPDATEPTYTGGAGGGVIWTDDTQSGNNYRPGPNGDAEIDGDSNIKGGKWLLVLKRGNGNTTTHRTCRGNNVDTPGTSIVFLETSFLYYTRISVDPNRVPLSTEYMAMGFHKTDGGRDITSEEMWAFILHVPDAGTTRRIFQIE